MFKRISWYFDPSFNEAWNNTMILVTIDFNELFFKGNMKALLSPVSIYWFNAVLLTNIKCCMEGSQVRIKDPIISSFILFCLTRYPSILTVNLQVWRSTWGYKPLFWPKLLRLRELLGQERGGLLLGLADWHHQPAGLHYHYSRVIELNWQNRYIRN